MHDAAVTQFRRIVLALVIGSFSLAALMGIAVLLAGAAFGETEGRVLLTTVVVGVESVAVLCYLAVAGRPTAFVGALGALVSLVPFGLALWLTWGGSEPDEAWRTFGITVTIAASIAQACLLLVIADRPRLRPWVVATLVAVTIVAGMIIAVIVDGAELDGTFWRMFGVIAILDVLGTLVLGALGAFGRKESVASPAAGPPPPAAAPSPLSAPVQARLTDVAHRRGVHPDRIVTDALDALERPV